MKRILSLSALLFSIVMQAQNHNHPHCGFDEYMKEQFPDLDKYEEYFGTPQAEPEAFNMVANGTVLQIPVVFHIISASEEDNISRAQVLDALRILNEDFRRTNADTVNTRNIFKPHAVDTEIEFVLARKDASGTDVDGITRIKNCTSLAGNDGSKINAQKYPRSRYLNIWVSKYVRTIDPNNPSNVLGYATFPYPANRDSINPPQGQVWAHQGIMVRHDELGSIGTFLNSPNNPNGRTLTHEVGHYLGLWHTFYPGEFNSRNGCTGPFFPPGSFPYGRAPGSASTNTGDYCDDTPPVNQANFGCTLSTNSCTNDSPDLNDQLENYMDYSSCQNMFSDDQKVRMRYTLSSLRTRLVSSSNAQFTGIANPAMVSPTASMKSDKKVVLTGDTVRYEDFLELGIPTSWSWSFQGGSPATSTLRNPKVVYNSPGKYDVTVTATNANGSDTKTYNGHIVVKDKANADYQITWVESFENGQVPILVTPVDLGEDGNTFQHYNSAGSHQTSSLVLNSQGVCATNVDELISPLISTAGASSLNLFFDYAFAAKATDNSDLLEVFVSRDGGENWIRRRFYNSGRLRTAGNTSGNFVPGASEWKTETINFDAFIGTDPILIKFRFENGGGNNFYIDNIRFGEGTDVSLDEYQAADLKVFPNPSKGDIHLRLSDLADRNLNLEVLDLSGKVVHQESLELQNSSLDKDLNLDLAKGVYLLQVFGRQTRLTEKLIIE